ncbi:MAG: malto-oligosyltrehalose trehalohydrolase [Dehalococcoidales bacterium]|nr:MAG: malto-oligosyltrehalose trehalohydrolase [Dehalococcoidales bacterium]
MNKESRLGAVYLGDGRCQFTVWAPLIPKVEVHIISPEELIVLLERCDRGYHRSVVEGIKPGYQYFYRLDSEKERPDPASRFQPEGVHGPSQVVDSCFPWADQQWAGLSLEEYIVYELHAGAFTNEGTFDAIIPCLDRLKDLGITAVELMPVAQFPGNRNWGYDGVYPFAVQDSYGGPEGLKRLINACHRKGLAVVLDVVYNHIGPEGNYLADFGPYFTDHYKTPWGAAINFDGLHSDDVRRFFIENAIYWPIEFHIDALRLDALHAILDTSAYPFIEGLAESFHKQVEKLGRKAYLIGESTANDARLLISQEFGGYGLDAQWNDEFHHSLHVLLTGEQTGYYQDYGQLQHLAKAFQEGFVYSGQYSSYRQRRHGVSSKDIPAHRLVVFAQNHDQVGNRMNSERLSQLVSFEALKLAAGIVLLSPFIPLLFMGEEYGEPAPFPYFVNHSEPDLIEAVRKGRRDEFAAFQWQGELPDPQDEATFLRAKLDHQLRNDSQNHVLLEFYSELIRLRKETPALAHLSKDNMDVQIIEDDKLLFLHRWNGDNEVMAIFSLNDSQTAITLPIPAGHWVKGFDSAEERWQGGGSVTPEQLSSKGEVSVTLSPWAFALFFKET